MSDVKREIVFRYVQTHLQAQQRAEQTLCNSIAMCIDTWDAVSRPHLQRDWQWKTIESQILCYNVTHLVKQLVVLKTISTALLITLGVWTMSLLDPKIVELHMYSKVDLQTFLPVMHTRGTMVCNSTEPPNYVTLSNITLPSHEPNNYSSPDANWSFTLSHEPPLWIGLGSVECLDSSFIAENAILKLF